MSYTVKGDKLICNIDSQLYPEEVLFKCLYWYTKRFPFEVIKVNEDKLQVYFTLGTQEGQVEPADFYNEFMSELVDFKVRALVNEETRTIRELIIAKAFANYADDTDPQTEVSDPVGFNIRGI